jgi:hypothetical protein
LAAGRQQIENGVQHLADVRLAPGPHGVFCCPHAVLSSISRTTYRSTTNSSDSTTSGSALAWHALSGLNPCPR